MKNSTQRICTRTLTARLSETQFQHIKAQVKPSCYLRDLIERDCQAVNDESS